MKKIIAFFKSAVSWIAVDGLLHFLVSALGVLALGLFLPLWVAVLIMAGAGLGKEAYDLIRQGKQNYPWSNGVHDLICDIAGITIGAVVAALYLFAL